MYNLIMSAHEGSWDKTGITWDMTRYLEYTNSSLTERFSPPPSLEVIDKLKALPTLFAYEFSLNTSARVGWITNIQLGDNTARITFCLDSEIPPLSVQMMMMHAWDLDLENIRERNHHHWAIKDVDLLAVLKNMGLISIKPSLKPKDFIFSNKTILSACDVLNRRLSQAQVDRLFVEINTIELPAQAEKGTSVEKRMAALGGYVLKSKNKVTATDIQITYFIVKRAAIEDSKFNGFQDSRITSFWNSLQEDGYIFLDGELVTIDGCDPVKAGQSRPYSLSPHPSETLKKPAIIEKPTMTQSKAKVFVVHGRNEATKLDVANFLMKLNLEPIILHERPNGGRTLITKFQEESADVQFAVVLMTPDDVGGLAGDEIIRPRARQNVIFELGFFIGKLGPGKVCALVNGNIEKPSDFDAVVYVPYLEGGDWKNQLARELRHANVQIRTEGLL